MVSVGRWRASDVAERTVLAGNGAMFVRMQTPVPCDAIGADIRFRGWGDDSFFYHVKDDSGLRPVRATEAFCVALAEHLGIAVAPWSPIEVDGDILFGSRQDPSPAEDEDVKSFCMCAEKDEIGARLPWRGSYFARLFVLDAFLGNVDRRLGNLVGHREGRTTRVRAIDFAASPLMLRPGVDIQLDGSQTRFFWRLMRGIHGDGFDAANEMIEHLRSVTPKFVETVLDRLPPGWLDAERVSRFVEFWRGGERIERLERLGAGLRDGSIL